MDGHQKTSKQEINDRSILQVSQRGVIVLHHIHSFVRRHISSSGICHLPIFEEKLLSRKRKCFNSRLHLSKMTSGTSSIQTLSSPAKKSAMIKGQSDSKTNTLFQNLAMEQ
ncbi:hypothetical protein BASA83_003654 [Batrachochytrium salamandrivorans]|nr:hypothetical protein BASA83_003654 [Batrachochytrium salamandrivorans]